MSNDIGIYKIKNIANGKVYIGQSRGLHKRLTQHKNLLNTNRHPNPHLQYSYNKYGAEGFYFEVIENCKINMLNNREIYWMNYYKSFDKSKGYNITAVNEELTSYALAEETKKKISDSHMKYDDDELLTYLQEYFYMEGKVPTQRDFVGEKYPSYTLYFSRFGSFKDGIIKAGLYDFVKNKKLFTRELLSREKIIENYEIFIKNNGRFPSTEEMRHTSKSGLYPTSSVMRVFNSIEEFKTILGFSKESIIQKENEDALMALKKLYDEQGYVEVRSIDKSRITKSGKFYSNRFGSFPNAYLLAGIDPVENRNRLKVRNLLSKS